MNGTMIMSKGWVVSLFDYTGNMVKPWIDAGYSAVIIDQQHMLDTIEPSGPTKLSRDLRNPLELPLAINDVVFISCFPPCTAMAVSGARWFKKKGLRELSEAISMFATAVEFCESYNAPWMIENPVSTISTYWRKPDYAFHPWEYTGYELSDNYTKKTCLWTSENFVMPDPFVDSDRDPDDRIHKAAPGPERQNFRSATPMGFARAVFEANRPDKKEEQDEQHAQNTDQG